MTFRKGDAIEVTCEGRTVDGVVIMISPNQISAAFGFDAMFGGHAGMMPAMAATLEDAERGEYFSIVDGTKVSIRSKHP